MSEHNTNREKTFPVVIVGGGITGLSLAAKLDQKGVPFALLEKKDRLGGQIRTLEQNGFTFETGPNTGSVSWPEVVELYEYLDGDARLEVADEASKDRWIWKGNSFHSLPSGPLSGLFTPLFTFKDKFRILLEPFRKPQPRKDETVGELASRRLGKSFVDYAVAPFVGGVYAGDPYKLITSIAFPKLYALENEHGSFIKGSIHKMKQPKSERDKKATKDVFSTYGGFGKLVDALSERVTKAGMVECSADIKQIFRDEKLSPLWRVEYTDSTGEEQVIYAENIVTTTGAYAVPKFMPWLSEEVKQGMIDLNYAPMIEVSVGFDHLPSNIKHKAFGGLIPPKEHRKILGILFPSATFTDRVPYPDSALFTIFMGGMKHGQRLLAMTDKEIIEEGLGELYAMLKIPEELKPSLIYVSRHSKAIPQYTSHMISFLPMIEEVQEENPGLYLAGGLRDGIGLANRIKQGTTLGERLAGEYLSRK